jgi:hypothetical protein
MDESFMNSEALIQAILARTSGSPCERLHALACDFVDGVLEEAQGSLLRGHMDHCAACAALVRALAESKAMLPGMAEVDPGPWFTQRVLRTTSRHPVGQGFDARAAWRRLLHRPRIALETAYLGAAMGLMGLHAPVPWHSLKPPALIQALPLKAPAERLAGRLVQAEQRTTASLRGAFLPEGEASSVRAIWRRASSKVRGWFPHREKNSSPANP